MSKLADSFKNKDFFCLWLAQIVSQFGDRINQMALIGLIAGRVPGSALGIAKILSCTIIPVFIVGPIAGVYVDRWDRRKTLFVCDFLRALLVLTIPFVFIKWQSIVPIYIIIFLVFCLSRFYVPAKMSIIPDLVEKKDLLIANSLVTTTGMLAFVCGALLGGFIVENYGAKGGFLLDAATFFISSALVFSISRDLKIRLSKSKLKYAFDTGKEMITTIQKSVFQEMKEAVSYLTNHKDIRWIIGMMFTLLMAAGAVYVVMIIFIQETFGSITRDLGLLALPLGVGLFVGSLLYGRLGKEISKFKIIFLCLITGGVSLVSFALTVQQFPNRFVAGILAFILGLMTGPIFIASNTVVHEVCHEDMRGKVFSGLEIVIHLAFLIAMFASGFLAEYVERFWILAGVGLISALVGLVGFLKKDTMEALSKK